MKLKSNLLTGI